MRGSESDLQKAVAMVGPISVAIDASRPTFHLYKKGLYYDPMCSSVRSVVILISPLAHYFTV